jgi:hypothetical protein
VRGHRPRLQSTLFAAGESFALRYGLPQFEFIRIRAAGLDGEGKNDGEQHENELHHRRA